MEAGCGIVMWTTRCRPQVDGGGRIQTSKPSTKHTRTAICLFDTVFRKLGGRYLLGDHRDGTCGDVQNVDEDERELTDEEDDECEGKENLETKVLEGVARSLGDLSMNGSLDGELKSRHTVDSRKPIVDWIRQGVEGNVDEVVANLTTMCDLTFHEEVHSTSVLMYCTDNTNIERRRAKGATLENLHISTEDGSFRSLNLGCCAF